MAANPTLPPILYEDDAVIAFDKPSGVLTSPDRWDKERGNLMDWIHSRISPDYFNAHRLDADTSGVIVCAKTKPALDFLCHQFERRETRKEYLAITRGAPAEETGLIRKRMLPDPRRPGRMKIGSAGKPAETQFEVLQRFRGFALVKCMPLTGRTHQIRVHLAFIGAPLVADTLYGTAKGLLLSEIKRKYKPKRGEEERPLLGRLGLHAERLTFTHPSTGKELTISAPLPKDFELSLKYLRRYAGGVASSAFRGDSPDSLPQAP